MRLQDKFILVNSLKSMYTFYQDLMFHKHLRERLIHESQTPAHGSSICCFTAQDCTRPKPGALGYLLLFFQVYQQGAGAEIGQARSSMHMRCWYHNWWLNPLCHTADPVRGKNMVPQLDMQAGWDLSIQPGPCLTGTSCEGEHVKSTVKQRALHYVARISAHQ